MIPDFKLSFVGSYKFYLAEDNFPRGIAFSPDGTKMFMVGDEGNDINEYTLTREFDLTHLAESFSLSPDGPAVSSVQ